MNARPGANISGLAATARVLFTVALACAGGATLMKGPRAQARLSGQPLHLFGAGVLTAFYVLSVTWIAPVFGVGNAVFFVLMGQLGSAALIDQFGLFGARQLALSPVRFGGLALMAAGLAMTQLGPRE
ncbi:transporter family-2 protein [Jannaschia faecimaris]|uniref:Transporter family-2 protein n=1 Tax=Jannaschia faecimaris TaxID=1244108 RepID=A0A1H3U353_9RHOB|nr:DMT family transporter [Jannaschia faecimaris]SDZ56782.1 transporter family-2 protein [Jannaschia faecimaris]